MDCWSFWHFVWRPVNVVVAVSIAGGTRNFSDMMWVSRERRKKIRTDSRVLIFQYLEIWNLFLSFFISLCCCHFPSGISASSFQIGRKWARSEPQVNRLKIGGHYRKLNEMWGEETRTFEIAVRLIMCVSVLASLCFSFFVFVFCFSHFDIYKIYSMSRLSVFAFFCLPLVTLTLLYCAAESVYFNTKRDHEKIFVLCVRCLI